MEASKLEALKKMEALEAEIAAAKEVSDAKAAEEAAAAAALLKEETDLEAELAEAKDTADLYSKVLALVASRTGAVGVYLGRKEVNEAGVSQIQYLSSTQDLMKGTVLKGVPEGEEEGAEGVTWPLFVSSEVEETVIDPETQEESTVTKTVFPEEIEVPNVVRDPAVKCFGLPKLGSYLAVPVRYSTCLHDASIEDAPPPPEPVAAEEVEGEAPTEPEVTEPPPKYSPVYQTAEYLIGLDTVGQGREFTAEEKTFAKSWAIKLAEASAAAELKLWNADIVAQEAMAAGEAAVVEGLAGSKEAAAAAAAEKLAALGDEASEDTKTLKDAEFKCAAALEVAKGLAESILSAGSCNVAPKAEAVKCLQAAAMLSGIDKASYMDVLTGKVDWKLIKGVVPSLLEKMEAFDASTLAPETLEPIKAVTEGLDENAIPFSHLVASSASMGTVLAWCNAAMAWVEAFVVFKQKEAEAAEAAAAAAAAEE